MAKERMKISRLTPLMHGKRRAPLSTLLLPVVLKTGASAYFKVAKG